MVMSSGKPEEDFFAADYAAARARFRAAASARGCDLESHAILPRGPEGQELTIDVALWKPAGGGTRGALVVSSGLHGVEGFFGSAVQAAWLECHAGRLAGDASRPPALVFVHGINPYGFAWRRRWNENNVDLNRNFLGADWEPEADLRYRESLRAYEELTGFLNPPSAPSRFEAYTPKMLARIFATGWKARQRQRTAGTARPPALSAIFRLGLAELRRTLPVGQYAHPRGLFFGGNPRQPEPSTRLIREHFPRWIGEARTIVHLDFHTGLGPYATYRLLIDDIPGSSPARWAADWFGPEAVEPLGGETAYQAHGVMTRFFQDELADRRYLGLAAEFGTLPAPRVLGALRAENRAHFYGRPGEPSYRWAKRWAMEAFCPSDPGWREAVLPPALALIDRAVEKLRETRNPESFHA
jgi:hypothetical protein